MKLAKVALYTGAGVLGTWAHLNGHDWLMNLAFVVWVPFAAADLASALSPWDEKIGLFGPRKEDGNDD